MSGVASGIIEDAAQALAEAEESLRPIDPLTVTHPDLTVRDAYAIQEQNVKERTGSRSGPSVVGHKIGLTSLPMQQMLGVDEPDFGVLYSDRVYVSGAHIESAKLIAPRIEPEIAFVLNRDLDKPQIEIADVLEATEYAVAALEVIDSRIADWKIKLIDTIADNASCASAVLGTDRFSASDVDLAAARVEFKRNDEVIDTGTGDAVLGHPAAAVAWLANALSEFGVILRRGETILSGSITAATPISPGEEIKADFGDLGSVTAVIR